MASAPENQNGTLQALTNALNVLTNTVKQAAALASPQLQPVPLSLPAAAVGATVSSSLNHVPAPQQYPHHMRCVI